MSKEKQTPAQFDDESPMPFGEFQGTRLLDVPAWYLIELYNDDLQHPQLKFYIEDNMMALKDEIRKEKLGLIQPK